MTSHSKSCHASGIFLLMISRALLTPNIHLWLRDKIAKYLLLLEECLAVQDSLISQQFCLGAPNHTFKNYSTFHLIQKVTVNENCDFVYNTPTIPFTKPSRTGRPVSCNFCLILIDYQPRYDRSTNSLRSSKPTFSKSHLREAPSYAFVGVVRQSQSTPDPPVLTKCQVSTLPFSCYRECFCNSSMLGNIC